MIRAEGLLTPPRLTGCFHTSSRSRHSPSSLSQASQYHHHLLLSSSSSPLSKCINTQQKVHFSSEPIATNEWSQGLEHDLLEKFHSTPLTHEAVVYILKTLVRTPNEALAFFNWVCDEHGFKPNSIVYNLMLLNLSTKETLKEFWGLTDIMSKEGCYVDYRAFLTVRNKLNKFELKNEAKSWTKYYAKMSEECSEDCTVKGVVDVVLGSDWNDDVMDKLEEFKGGLSENTVMILFQALAAIDTLKALFLFRWLKESGSYPHNAVTYNGILRFLCKKEVVEAFWSVVEEMKGAGHDMDLDTYVLISKQFQKKNMMEDLVQLYELIMDGEYKAPSHRCDCVLNIIGHSRNPDLNLIVRVIRKYEETGHALYKGVYDGLYKCWVDAGGFSEAEKVFDAMRSANLQPDKETYDCVLFTLGRAGKMDEAMGVLDEMEAKGYVPDSRTWNNLIRGLCRGNEFDQALKCFGILLEKNVKVDADVMDVLVNDLCTKRRMYYAYYLLTEAVSKSNLKPFYTTYISLIQHLLRDRKFGEGIHLLHTMKKHKYQPVIGPFVEHISKYGTVEKARELLEAFSKHPTVPAYYNVLQGFLKEGRRSEAQEFLEACPPHIREHADIFNVFPSLKPVNATI